MKGDKGDKKNGAFGALNFIPLISSHPLIPFSFCR